MLILAVKELQNGLQTVGGGSNIGRGRLAGSSPVIPEKSEKSEQDYLDALAKELNKSGRVK